MTETVKNFLAIGCATVIFVLGIASIIGTIMVIDTLFDGGWTVFTAIVTALFALSLYAGRQSERVKVALDYPFTFFG